MHEVVLTWFCQIFPGYPLAGPERRSAPFPAPGQSPSGFEVPYRVVSPHAHMDGSKWKFLPKAIGLLTALPDIPKIAQHPVLPRWGTDLPGQIHRLH